jgi:hypothetical protein
LEKQLAEELAAIELSTTLAIEERKSAAELLVSVSRQVRGCEMKCVCRSHSQRVQLEHPMDVAAKRVRQ